MALSKPRMLALLGGDRESAGIDRRGDQGVLDRFQLFRALQMQDRLPGVRLGECAAALGYAPIAAIERLYERFTQLHTVDVD